MLRAAAGLVLVQQSMMGKFFLDLVRFVLDRSVGWPWLGWARWRGGRGGGAEVQLRYSSSKGQIAKLVELRIGLRREGKVRYRKLR